MSVNRLLILILSFCIVLPVFSRNRVQMLTLKDASLAIAMKVVHVYRYKKQGNQFVAVNPTRLLHHQQKPSSHCLHCPPQPHCLSHLKPLKTQNCLVVAGLRIPVEAPVHLAFVSGYTKVMDRLEEELDAADVGKFNNTLSSVVPSTYQNNPRFTCVWAWTSRWGSSWRRNYSIALIIATIPIRIHTRFKTIGG